MATSATDKQHLEQRAIDAINEFLNRDENVSIYVEDLMEDLGLVLDGSSAMTNIEMEVWSMRQAEIKMKLLAKVIGVL